MPDLIFTTSGAAKVVAAVGQINKAVKDAKKAAEGVEGDGAKQGGMLDSFPKKLMAVAGGWASIHKAAQLVTDEMQLQQDLIDKRTQSQLTVGAARDTLLRSMVGGTDAEKSRAMAASRAIANKTGVSEARIAPALADAISAIGGDVSKAIKATTVAANYMRSDPEQITEFAGSLLDISKSTGTSNATTNLGLYQQLGRLSRVNNPNFMQQTIPGALSGMGSFGASYQDAGAVFAGLSNAAGDKFGRSTRTASIQMTKQLGEFFEEKGEAGLSLDEQIKKMQSSPALGKEFFTKRRLDGFGASFEAKSLGALRGLLLNPNSVAAQEYAKSRAEIPGLGGLNALGAGAMGDFEKYNALGGVGERTRAIGTASERIAAAGSQGSLSTDEREQVKQMMMAAGFSGVGARLANFSAGVGDGADGLSTEAAVGLLQRARGKANFAREAGYDKEKNTETIRAIDDLIKKLESDKEDSKRQTTALESINAKMGFGGGLVAGTA